MHLTKVLPQFKPGGVKTLALTLKLLGLLLFVAIFSSRTGFGSADEAAKRPFELKLTGKYWELKPGHDGYDQFKAVLDRNHGLYCLKHKEKDHTDGTPGKEKPLDNGGCKTLGTASLDINQRDLALICRGSHVTQTASFTTQSQLDAVKAEFVSPP